MPPVTIGLPPLAAVYQRTVDPVQVAVKVTEPLPHLAAGGTVGGAGFAWNPPAIKSSSEAVIDCDDLVSSKKLEKQKLGFGLPLEMQLKSITPS